MENAAPGAPFIGFREEETVASRGRVEAVAESGKLGAKLHCCPLPGSFWSRPIVGPSQKEEKVGCNMWKLPGTVPRLL